LGLCLKYGEGILKDEAESVVWLRKSAEQGDVVAQRSLGESYLTGTGVGKDLDQAEGWLRKSAEQNDPVAWFDLGSLYGQQFCDSQKTDYNKALHCILRAADLGYADAQVFVGKMLMEDESAEKRQKGFALIRLAADQGQAEAQYLLAYSWLPAGDAGKYIELLRMSAQQGHLPAQVQLAKSLTSGKIDQYECARDRNEAMIWAQIAAGRGDKEAQLSLGNLCFDGGAGITTKIQDALYWWTEAAKQGEAMAQYNLGITYYRGEVVPQDYRQAYSWMKMASDQNLAAAQRVLGVMNFNGEGVEENVTLAYVLLRKAAENGDNEASEILLSIGL
jgi:TPR repeat protein